MNVTAYHFFRMGNQFELVKDGNRYTFSAEMVTCLINQYRLMGYIIETTELWISAVKIF